MHKPNFEITKCCGYKVLINSFLSQKINLCKFGTENHTGSEDRAQKMLNLQFFKDDDLEMRVTKIISTLHFATMVQYIKFT